MILFLMQIQEYKEVVTTTDATVQGILLALVFFLITALVFLYRKTEATNKERFMTTEANNEKMINLLKETRDTLIEQANKYNEFSNNMLKFQDYVRENRK